jgi:hypothetical protein
MKNYTDIKIARSDLRKLTEIYQYCVAKKEKLKASLTDNGSFDVRCEAYVYRLGLNEMKKRIIEIKKNIKQLDREATQRDIERVKREFPNLFN